jgi:peptidoglycan/LPS O-acetylase OafA/YrhL
MAQLNKNILRQRPENQTLSYLNGLRGIAAIYVMIFHAKWLLWESFHEGYINHPQQYSLINKFFAYFFSIFKYGHEAVLFFFVLSGFVIHLSYSRKLIDNNNYSFEYFNYLYKRIKRIYPPLLFAILLTFILDYAGYSLQYRIYHHQTPMATFNNYVDFAPSFRELAGNLLLVNGTYVKSWGSNGPLWSLKFEWWFYMIYPLVFFINKKSILLSAIILFICAVYFLSGGYFPVRLISDVLAAMFTWWLGAILADMYTGRIKIEKKYFLLAWLIVPFQIIYQNKIAPGFFDLLMGVDVFAFLLTLIIIKQMRPTAFALLEKISPVGDFSYTLYITHLPVLIFLNGIMLSVTNNIMPMHFGFVFLGIGVCITVAYLSHFIVEKPFMKPSKRTTGKYISPSA